MSLDLKSGGHLSHGYFNKKRKVSATSSFYNCSSYYVNKIDGLIDYKGLEMKSKVSFICSFSNYIIYTIVYIYF